MTVVSRASGGLPVALSGGCVVSYSRTTVTTSSPAVSVTVVTVRVLSRLTDVSATLSVVTFSFRAVTSLVAVLFSVEQLMRHRTVGSMRAQRYFAHRFFES